ncbi:MAG: bifunctional hydroxymethylpyrimidine kinase/phosphomethylpyrimidine kinase [Gemmatimonadetes bacterium]|nr:bifunctional hydroxymethylpyrimidine kinase/phosphomethylpyrimidine kinase [Gemmatimonadota bacterium]
MKRSLMTAGLMLLGSAALFAHDFWLVPNAFLLAPGAELVVDGRTSSSFPSSLSAVTVDRVAEARILSASASTDIEDLSVHETSLRLRHRVSAAGQLVVAVRIHPRNIPESAESFRHYLALEGAPELLERVIDICVQQGIFIAVDPMETNFHSYKRVSLITPNHHEAAFTFGRKIRSEEDLLAVGNGLLAQLDAGAILITRGPEGMSLFQRDHESTHIPTFARHVFDVTGAGDTVVAVYVSAVCAGASLVEAAIVANAAAGHTVGEVGTSTVTVSQLGHELRRNIKNGVLVPTRS